MSADEFNPDWTIAPGETLREWLEENGLSVRVAARACGLERDVLEQLLVGDVQLTEHIAQRLKGLTMIPVSFWLNAERRYRSDLERGRIDTTLRPL